MTGDAVTAVIPAFNATNSVAAAVASLKAQTVPPAEIIVVDDGSVDDTAEVARRAGARVIQQENAGPGAARNTGIRAANTPWIALLDADDIARASRLESQLAEMGAEQVAVIFAGAHTEGKPRSKPSGPIGFDMLWKKNCIPTSTVVLRRSAWEEIGGFNESRDLIGVEDYHFWLRIAHAGWEFTRVNDILVDYLPGPASLTAQTRRFAAAEIVNARLIAYSLSLPPSMLRQKEFNIFKEYGFELFHARDLPGARDFLGEASLRGPIGLGGQLRRLATWFPRLV